MTADAIEALIAKRVAEAIAKAPKPEVPAGGPLDHEGNPLDARVIKTCQAVSLPVSGEFADLVEYLDKSTGTTKKRVDVDWERVRKAWVAGDRDDLQAAMVYHLGRTGRIVIDGFYYGLTPCKSDPQGMHIEKGFYVWPEEKIGKPPIWKSMVAPKVDQAVPTYRNMAAD